MVVAKCYSLGSYFVSWIYNVQESSTEWFEMEQNVRKSQLMNEEKRGVIYNRQLHHTINPTASFGIFSSPNRPRSGNAHLTSGCPALTD